MMMRIRVKLRAVWIAVAVVRAMRLADLSAELVVVGSAVVRTTAGTRFINVYGSRTGRSLGGSLSFYPVTVW